MSAYLARTLMSGEFFFSNFFFAKRMLPFGRGTKNETFCRRESFISEAKKKIVANFPTTSKKAKKKFVGLNGPHKI